MTLHVLWLKQVTHIRSMMHGHALAHTLTQTHTDKLTLSLSLSLPPSLFLSLSPSLPPPTDVLSGGGLRHELVDVWSQRCAFVIDEILQTEGDYVNALDDIIQVHNNYNESSNLFIFSIHCSGDHFLTKIDIWTVLLCTCT